MTAKMPSDSPDICADAYDFPWDFQLSPSQKIEMCQIISVTRLVECIKLRRMLDYGGFHVG